MLTDDVLYQLNPYLSALVMFVLLAVAAEGGYWVGRRRKAHAHMDLETVTGHLNEIQTVIFAVLGLLLAFTFSTAVSRFDARKQALIQETNAIGTAYLRTDLLPPAQQLAAKELFREYVDTRLALNTSNGYLNVTLRSKSSNLQQHLWSQAVAEGNQDTRAVTTSLYIQSLNDMFDAQTVRDEAQSDHLPSNTNVLVILVASMAMGVFGLRSGLTGYRSMYGTLLLVFVLTFVFLVIRDLDHPYQGFFTISQQVMIQLRQSMGNVPTGR